MKKEIRLALLGISIALGSPGAVGTAMAQSTSGGDTTQHPTMSVARISATDITQIRQCVLDTDVLCLRTILATKPTLRRCSLRLSPWERNLCQALDNFWLASARATNRDIFGEVKIALSASAAIYS